MINYKKLIKSTVYRFYSMSVTIIVSFITTGNWILAATIGLADSGVKILTYYGFDTIWDRLFNKKMKPSVIFFTGLSGSGKTTIGKNLQDKLTKLGQKSILLDGDEIRKFFPNTGFDEASRKRHNLNVGYMASYFEKQGLICIVTLIAPYADVRNEIRKTCSRFFEVYVNTPIEECEKRDPKGLYDKVRKGEIKDFTGIHPTAPYEAPAKAEIVLNTISNNIEDCSKKIIDFVWHKN